jgi:hypothetical protein
MSGSTKIIQIGTDEGLRLTLRAMRETSVAVSKPKPEEDSDGVYLPRFMHDHEQRVQKPVHEATFVEHVFEFLPLRLLVSLSNLLEDAVDPDRDDQVDETDEDKENPRDQPPDVEPALLIAGMLLKTAHNVMTSPKIRATTMVEYPRENQRPTESGRLFSCINFRVVLSMSAIWSASTPWRRPKV